MMRIEQLIFLAFLAIATSSEAQVRFNMFSFTLFIFSPFRLCLKFRVPYFFHLKTIPRNALALTSVEGASKRTAASGSLPARRNHASKIVSATKTRASAMMMES